MKKISIISFIFVLGLFSWNCSQQTVVSEPEYEFTEVAIPDNLKSDLKVAVETETFEDDIMLMTKEGKEVYGKVRLTFPVNDDYSVVKAELTNNIFQETGLSADFWLRSELNGNLKSLKNVGACLVACKKADHPGWCKIGCWVEVLINAAAQAL